MVIKSSDQFNTLSRCGPYSLPLYSVQFSTDTCNGPYLPKQTHNK